MRPKEMALGTRRQACAVPSCSHWESSVIGSLEVGADNVDQGGDALRLVRVPLTRGIDDVVADMIFERRRREPVHGAPHRCHDHQHVGAAEFGFESAFDRLDLFLDASDAAEKLGLVMISVRTLALLILSLLWTQSAHAQGIAGNRSFNGTMMFDDPAVARRAHSAQVQLSRLSGARRQWCREPHQRGFRTAAHPDLGLHHRQRMGSSEVADRPYLRFGQDQHQSQVRNLSRQPARSVGLRRPCLGTARSGAAAVEADAPHTIQTDIFFGKGFGDLPDPLSELHPLAITGSLVDEVPIDSGGRALAPNPVTGSFDTVLSPTVETLHWGFSIPVQHVQYSTLYLTSRFDGGPPKEEPLNQLVPLVGFRFDRPRDQYTAATADPGFAYVAVAWQVAAEAIIPLSRVGGTGRGFRVQLLLFLDNLIVNGIAEPSRSPGLQGALRVRC
jgi:hypothetical protein